MWHKEMEHPQWSKDYRCPSRHNKTWCPPRHKRSPLLMMTIICPLLMTEADEYIFDPLEKLDDLNQPSTSGSVKDPSGVEMFNPSKINHPRGSDWWPHDHVAKFIKLCIRKPLERESRNLMRSECPSPSLDNKAGLTPILDPELLTFLFKTGRDPRKGHERRLKQCQDKLLDTLGPLARILDLAEESSINGTPVDT